jgi:membrane-associated phospholipid phosphatase
VIGHLLTGLATLALATFPPATPGELPGRYGLDTTRPGLSDGATATIQAAGTALVQAIEPAPGSKHSTRTIRAATVGEAARERTARLTRRDAYYGLAAVAAVAVAYPLDEKTHRLWANQGGKRAETLADIGRNFGGPAPLIALAAAGLGAWAFHDRDRLSSIGRVAVGLASAQVVSTGLKFAVGRYRPNQSADDHARFKPFSGHASFPSGHATTAFALASGISTEVGGGWVPWVAYPLATLTAWSRVHDDQHWLSDVVAGGFIGHWVGRKIVQLQRDHAGLGAPGHAQHLDLVQPEGSLVAMRWTF